MLPSTIRAVAFDAVGTVMFPNPPAADVYSETALQHGIVISPTEVSVQFRAAIRREDEIDRTAKWVTSEARERERWWRIVTDALPGVPASCFNELFAHFAKPGSWKVPAEVGPVLEALANRGIKLGLASNYDSRLRPVLEGLPQLQPLADRVVVSSEVGVRKPGGEFFKAVTEAMDELPERIAFVGDDRVNDYDGATTAGMFAVLLDPANQHGEGIARIQVLTDLFT